MQREERDAGRYSDDVQNAGLSAREHEGTHMGAEERKWFGINDAVLRHRETLMQLRDENDFPEDGEN